ncbi:hypothetical protein [Sphingomonas sp. OTU376]|uniref:hypothetical protein n=1 Tax=Sphingomonas sp. OTU376 TaxID=3043863 RepID=UPI00313EA5D4
MADENLVTNLFGDLVQPPREGRGRRPHIWTRENSNRALLAFVLGRRVPEVAKLIGVSEPTFRKVYFKEVKLAGIARSKMELRQLERLNDQAEKGNVTAEKELAKMIEKIVRRDVAAAMSVPVPTEAPKRGKMGKKEQARVTAAAVQGLYEPQSGPTQH